MPVVLYGKKENNEIFFVDLKEFRRVWKKAGESTVIDLKSGDKIFNVIIQSVAIDPIKNEPIHADFLAVEMDKLITASIPLIFEGIAPAIKELGGVLVKVMHELEIEALPNDLPHELKIDISKLASFEDKILVSDIFLPAGVKAVANPDDAAALVEPPREDEEGEKTPALEDIEVEKKGKKEEEGGESDGESKK